MDREEFLNTLRDIQEISISLKENQSILKELRYELCIRKKGKEDSPMHERIIDRVLIEDEQYKKVDRNVAFAALANRIDCYNNLIERFYMINDSDLLEFTNYDPDEEVIVINNSFKKY